MVKTNSMTLNVIKHTRIWLGISAVLMILSIVSIATFGLNFGIDFTGGSLIEVRTPEQVSSEDVRTLLADQGVDAQVQSSDDENLVLRLGTLQQEEYANIISILENQYGEIDELRFESVGPIIGQELKRKSLIAVILLAALIVVYVAWAFRKVSEPIASWKYGLLTIIAALHDMIVPVGVFAVLGHVAGYQIDTAFIAALLTILGYSINDTIVVFDRTRENLVANRHSDASFDELVNKSVVQSFARSINTSLTTTLVLLAIFLFGGVTTRSFVLALIVGVLSGAYSSIFLASPLLVLWNRKK